MHRRRQQCLPGRAGRLTTQGIAACNGQEQSFWDDMLNYAYGELETALDPDVFKSLKTAQKAWVPWRDANCTFVYDSTEGTIRQIFASYCLMEITGRRAADLLSVLDDKIGGGEG
ncbi:MAG: lysozyme inhibitor LprI family protein [Devosia sp.]